MGKTGEVKTGESLTGDAVTTTTPTPTATTQTRPSAGWWLEVTDADGYTHGTTPVEDENLQPRRNPKANARPSITLPVAESTKWAALLDPDTDINLSVYRDGKRQPIDTLEDVEDRPGATVLEGRGGRELKQRFETAYDQEPVHSAVETLVTDNTSYTANVDTPPTTVTNSQRLAVWTDEPDFRANFAVPLTPSDPIVVNDGDVALAQSGWFESASLDLQDSNGDVFVTPSGHSDLGARRINLEGDWLEYEFGPLEYDLPATQLNPPRQGLQYSFRFAPESGDNLPELTVTLSGDDGSSQTLEVLTGDWTTNTAGNFAWFSTNETSWNGLRTGVTYTIRFEVTDAATLDRYIDIDAVWVGDGRFNPTLDNTVASDGDPLDGPEEYPDEWTLGFATLPAPEAVRGATVDVTTNDSSGIEEIAVSNDQGESFDRSGSGVTSHDADFTDNVGDPTYGPGVDVELKLARYGSGGSTSPATGFNGQNVQDITLSGDLEDLPIVVNRSFDGHLDDVITKLTELADGLWSVDYDGGFTVEWTTPGQRDAINDPTPSDFRATKSVRDVYQSAAVYGTSDVDVRGEGFAADHGTAVALKNDRIQPGSERVLDTDSGTSYRRQVDYTMDYQAGEITALAAGNLSDGTAYEIDYKYQAFGEVGSGFALEFEASNSDNVTVPSPGYDPADTFKVEIWLSPASDVGGSTTMGFFKSSGGTTSLFRSARIVNGSIAFHWEDESGTAYISNGHDVTDWLAGEWRKFEFEYDGGDFTISEDGSVVDTVNVGDVNPQSIAGDLIIGEGVAVPNWDGKMDNLKLDIDGVTVGEWTFDEGSGSTVEDTAGSNDGTITGATYTEYPGASGEAPPAEIPGLPSDFLCQQAARIIVDEVSEPLFTAEVTLPNDATGWSVVESFDPDIVPTGGNALHVRDVVNTPEQTVLTLGSRRSFSDVVEDIRAQVEAVARKA